MKYLLAISFKIFYFLLLAANKEVDWWERVKYYCKGVSAFVAGSFIIGAITDWYADEKLFTAGLTFIVFANAAFGGFVHWKKLGDFDWEDLLKKTITMIVVVWLSYVVFEIIISAARPEVVASGFRSALQVATLAYPGAKILKNIHIYSNGEHPPQWIMKKLYNFEKNGDLKAFLETNDKDDETNA